MIEGLIERLLRATQPLRAYRGRSIALERLLGASNSSAEFASIQAACSVAGVPTGAWYHWRWVQTLLLLVFRHAPKAWVMRVVTHLDRTDYAAIAHAARAPGGLLVVTPHHGHFLLSIVAFARRMARTRHVSLFYDAPQDNAGNAMFDALFRKLRDSDTRVAILHNNRAGIAGALKALRAGEIVVLMPDAYRRVEDTFQVPFHGRARHTLLGMAVMARRTGATLLPMISRAIDGSASFASCIGTPIAMPRPCGDAEADATRDLFADYATTVEVYRQFEQLMGNDLHYWQHCRTHFHGPPALPVLTGDALAAAATLFLADPRLRVELTPVISLDD